MSQMSKTPKKLATHRRFGWLAILTLFFAGVQPGFDLRAHAAEDGAAAEGAATVESESSERAAQKAIEDFHAGLIDIMKHAKELGFEGRVGRLSPLMKHTFDLDFMASKTVGRHWNKLSDEDKARWITIFSRFTTAKCAGRFTGYTGEEFITLGVEDAPRSTRMVMTKIVIPDEDDVELNYRLVERKDGWKVVDVFLDGTVSELALRRSDFRTTLKKSGFEQLIASVETKIEDLKTKGQADG